ncbi:MAG: hypothetical protein HDR88_17245 [Bacteroides sp.]|nr:hypothetical protein [Bacteroides sp.]
MFTYNIVKLAAKQRWSVTVTRSRYGYSFDFRRRTLGGFPFCFTAELTENRPGTLVDEIFSFVNELDPVHVAEEWLEASDQFSLTRFCQAVVDMDEIRTQAFLLAIELAEAVESDNIFFHIPWYLWN